MRSKKYDIEFLICLLLLLGFIFICVFNLRARLTYKVYTDYNNTYSMVYDCIGNKKTYDIKTEYKNHEVNMIGERAFYKKPYLKEVNLPSSIETIEKLAFSECSRLESINLENVLNIERNAFSYCYNLNNITLNVEEINSSLFFKAESLSNIELNNTKIIYSYAFAYTKIETLDLPDTINYETGITDYAFYYMNSLTKVIVHNNNLYNFITNNYDRFFNNENINVVMEVSNV